MGKSRLEKVELRTFDLSSKPKSEVVKYKEPEETYFSIPLDLIEFESNIRTEYDDEDINSLALSMKHYGQLEPVRVYENKENKNYIIIFGHRRYKAAQLAGIKELKCVITAKPDTLDKLYLQAIENEQSASLSSSDREKYIKLLRDKYKQSVAEISQKLGKTDSWIYTSLNAVKIRELHGNTFNNADITLSTRDTRALNNATEDQIKQAVSMIVDNPGSKTKVLENLRTNNKKKKTSSSRKEEFISPEDADDRAGESPGFETHGFNDPADIPLDDSPSAPSDDSFKSAEIKYIISKSDEEMKVKIKSTSLGGFFDENHKKVMNESLKTYYENKGFSIEFFGSA